MYREAAICIMTDSLGKLLESTGKLSCIPPWLNQIKVYDKSNMYVILFY